MRGRSAKLNILKLVIGEVGELKAQLMTAGTKEKA